MVSEAEFLGTKERLRQVEQFHREAARDILTRDQRIRDLELENLGLKVELQRVRSEPDWAA